ncbi:MAG TPA: 50S ribosomal protein L6 [Candidatus Polarisedimenticolia bacterium]|nr:50S ribosomal protein L6 [Candidatus Polarisedimenticolia bacterium]
MSRIGKLPVALPQGVSLSVVKDAVQVKGPKGTLTTPLPAGIKCAVEGAAATLTRRNDERQQRALHGLARALLANAVKGVSTGWTRDLEIQGIGYRATVQGKNIEFALGYSHPVIFPIPEGVAITVDKQTRVVVSGADRQKVGQVAAEIRSLRPPEPYKGKGIRYADEVIKKKVGKTGA